MADDFDKEAGDVMENQIITENPLEFSITVIKKEVLNFYDSEFESTTSSVQDRKPYLQEEIIPNTFDGLSSEISDNEIYQDKVLNCNKIILGSKPNLVSDDEDHCEYSDELYTENDMSFAKDPKLHPDSIDENYFEELVTSYEPKVELLDIQSYLHKSRRYCATCGILFPEVNAFEKHVGIYHKASDLNKRRIYKCAICDKKFVAPHVLRTHLINIHKINYVGHEKNKNIKNNATKELDSQIVNHDNTLEWSNTCFHCKKTFDTQKCLIEHLYDILQMKRKNTEIVPVLKSILFKCNKCDINFTSSQFAASHSEHMEMLINWKCTICNRIFKKEDALSHERQHSVSNNFLVYNLEHLDVTRILYKCSKCAVHFTESNFLYHFRDCGLQVSKSVHCKICNMSLDYNTITSHESEDHTVPNYYTVIESDVISDNPVKLTAKKNEAKDKLQKLSKTFRQVKVVLQRIKSNKVNKSNSVKWSSDESLSNLESSSYDQSSDSPQKPQKDNNASGFGSTTETTVRNQKKIDLRRKHDLTYYYCETCKCFVSKLKKKFHLKARCKKISKETCKRCGLTFTTASLMTHKRLHKEKKDLSLNNFKFFNLYNGLAMNLPVPGNAIIKGTVSNAAEVKKKKQSGKNIKNWKTRHNLTYYYCETCKCAVTNFKKDVHLEARCKNFSKETCKRCGLTFTTASLMTHKRLHKEKRDISLQNFKFFNLYNGKPMDIRVLEVVKAPIHIDAEIVNVKRPTNVEAKDECILQPVNDKDEFDNVNRPVNIEEGHICSKSSINNEAQSGNVKPPINVLPDVESIISRVKNDAMVLNTKCLSNIQPAGENIIDIVYNKVYNAAEVKKNKRSAKNIKNWKKRRNLTYYYCETCKCAVTHFKKDVHLEARCKNFSKETCKRCGLTFTTASLMTHKRLHKEKKDLSLNNFKFFNLYNGKPMNIPVLEVGKAPIHIDAEVVNVKRPSNVEAKDECILQPVNGKDEFDNVNRPVNIEEGYICSKSPINNEAQSGNVKPPINVTPDVESIISPVNNDAVISNTKCLSKIQAAVESIIGLVYKSPIKNEAQSGNVKPPINVIHDIESIISPVNNDAMVLNTKCLSNIQAEVENITGLVAEVESEKQTINIDSEVLNSKQHCSNNQTEIENIKRFVNNVADVENLIRPINNNPEVENFENPINIETEDTNIELHVNSKPFSDNKALDESINLHVEDENIAQLVNIGKQFAEIERPVTYEDHNDMSTKFVQKYYHCVTCKCFVTHFRKNTHLRARCKKLAKMTCKNCGLTFTKGSMLTHTRLHEVKKDLTLNNFKFFNLYNGQPMNPPIQEIVGIKQTEGLEVVNMAEPSHIKTDALHLKVRGNAKDWRTKFYMTLYYCETCECFVTKFRKALHLQARCKNFAKVTCECCGLTVTSNSIMTHKRLHEEMKEFTLNNFTIFNLYNGQPMNSHSLEILSKKKNINVFAKMASLKPAGKEAEIINKKRPINIKAKRPRRNRSYYFCENCKCFVTKFTKDAHLQARCKNFSKITCKLCGLRFTKASMMTHKRLHKENKDLSVNFFESYYLNNGQPMNAPVSEAVNRNRLVDERNLSNYYCDSCKCFETEMTKGGHIQENCINISKLPCKYCGLIFSSTSFALHKSLHEERKNLTLKNFTFFDLQNGKPLNPPLPEYPKCISCAVYFLTITARNGHICSEVSSLTCHICEIKLSEAAFKLHMSFHQFITDNTKIKKSNNVQSASSVITINLNKNNLDQIDTDNHGTVKNVINTSNHESHETELHNSVVVDEPSLLRSPGSMVYTCRNCSVSVDTYDKAVEHSQRHYVPEEHVTQTKVCEFCNLNIDEACYTEHQNVHENGSQFNFLHFDSYYLPADNNLWIKHIFEILPNEKIVDILRNSIYKFECRIKMDVIQQGDPNLTVYKCDQCGCFIEPSSLFKHSDNACFKLRNHPCTVCGIPFNSSASRIDHEQIHNHPNLTMESYRIVVFNRERDVQINRSFCLRKNYVLYKCRNCDVIIDKLREDGHKCDCTNVKKCPGCALLLNMTDYESHMNMHKEFISFNYSNMKVILLGEANSLEVTSKIISKSKFKGAIYDYKMFVCNKCEMCIRNEEIMLKHICRFGKQRSKCLKCGLYFSVGRLKTHTRCHEQDPDFLRSNMYIITFDPCAFDNNKNDTKLYRKNKDSELSDSNTDSDSEILSANYTSTGDDANTEGLTIEHIEEETAKIYKCTCELHFLNEFSLYRHFNACRSNPKLIKLKCQKCELQFTPNVLFTHLLVHHNNNGRRYKYDIIEIDCNRGNMIQ